MSDVVIVMDRYRYRGSSSSLVIVIVIALNSTDSNSSHQANPVINPDITPAGRAPRGNLQTCTGQSTRP